jgi:hypothetical protein
VKYSKEKKTEGKLRGEQKRPEKKGFKMKELYENRREEVREE